MKRRVEACSAVPDTGRSTGIVHSADRLGLGRLVGARPVAVIDIGSNSVRLVIYETLSRAPTVLFNEKVLAGLGKHLSKTGRLATSSIADALTAIRRFSLLCDHVGVAPMDRHAVATAATRDATNGGDFIAKVEVSLGSKVWVLSGKDESRLAALGVVSGFWKPDGIVGDLGGGSLELVDLTERGMGAGQTFPLGGIRLQEDSNGKPQRARKIAARMLAVDWLSQGRGRNFYAVGGTWRSLARLHMFQQGYPLHVMHYYTIPVSEAIEFCYTLIGRNLATVDAIDVVSRARRPLLPYGAAVLAEALRQTGAARVVLSALGLREGLLYDLLRPETQTRDPLIEASRDLCAVRARAPRYCEELIGWTDTLFSLVGLEETEEERRLRRAGCLLSDIAWRAHPDYRGTQSLAIISNAAFTGLNHAGRAYLALAAFYRHEGLIDDALSPRIRELATVRLRERARGLGAALRLASLISASTPGMLPRTRLDVSDTQLLLRLPGETAALDGERLRKRLQQLARLFGLEAAVAPIADEPAS